jgi:DNA processing protein
MAVSAEHDTDMDETAAWLALSRVATTGTRSWLAAALKVGSPLELCGRAPQQLAALGLARDGGRHPPPVLPALDEMKALIDRCRGLDIECAPISSTDYPPLLRTLDDPPLFLFYKGVAPALAEPCAAIVGARRASHYGRRVAADLAGRLAAAGFWVVSGMALGIDAAAHQGALSRGRTVAVLAGGLDQPSPPSHRRLYDAILKEGTALSEHPPGMPSYPGHFPVRNRIITGLCPLVVVVEAAERSGSLISARLGNEQGREVLAVPGNIDSANAAGTNRLIRDGCAPLVDPREVIAQAKAASARFGQFSKSASNAPSRTAPEGGKPTSATVFSSHADKILAALGSEPAHVDAIADAVGLDQARVMTLLTALELDGMAERLAAGTFVRAGDLTPR